MFHNIARCAVLSAPVTPFDVSANLSALCASADKVLGVRPDFVVFGELCLSGGSCGNLLRRKKLLGDCLDAAFRFAELYKASDTVFVLGLPLAVGDKVVSAAAVIYAGAIQAFCASRRGPAVLDTLTREETVTVGRETYPVLINSRFTAGGVPFTVIPGLSTRDCLTQVQGSVVLAPTTALSDPAHDYMVGARYSGLSAALGSAIVLCACGAGESSYHGVYKNLGGIFENGAALGFQYDFEPIGFLRDVDLDMLPAPCAAQAASLNLGGAPKPREVLNRHVAQNPFLPGAGRERILDDIADTQIHGLATRLKPAHLKRMVLGVSGGVDSAHALLVCAAACDRLGMERSDIMAILMPGPGTSEQSQSMAETLCAEIGAKTRIISIEEAVLTHFNDIGHDPLNKTAVYENAQARERTQILFDVAGGCDGLVVGTGDLSEAALGWCTFGADHLSGYNVNASLTKSMVVETAKSLARRLGGALPEIIEQIAEKPPSPELLPGKQITQDILGPYALHDFFLYYFVRHNLPEQKIIALAVQSFEGEYEPDFIIQTFETFRRRFLTSQFKRGCAPEGVLFGEISLSPFNYHFPSDLTTVNF